MNFPAQKLLIEIAKCKEVNASKNDTNHPCYDIVNSQCGSVPFQLPEPWNGDISEAEILFIASNPSYNCQEKFPNSQWSDGEIESFFVERFDDSYYRSIRYYKLIKKYACWILSDDKMCITEIVHCKTKKEEGVRKCKTESCQILDDKICITEIVHCKSKKEEGVRKCKMHCADKWLKKVLDEFNGQYIVLLGVVAGAYKNEVKQLTGITPIVMPHPNAHGITDNERKKIIQDWRNSN